MFRPKKIRQVEVICFDLFYTLADCGIPQPMEENVPLGITADEWNHALWQDELAHDRSIGAVKTDLEIIERACALLPHPFTPGQIESCRRVREERLQSYLMNIRPEILQTLDALRGKGIRLGLISNADACDCLHWNDSPLAPYFDDAIFSCKAGMEKPDPAIYRLSLQHLHADPSHAVFVGDGGSNEHKGAKETGMTTVCTEYLLRRPFRERIAIHRYSDHVIRRFRNLLSIIE